MARNSEVVRQWEILRDIDAARCGISISKLASQRDVHARTVRRDIDALSRAGFPLYDHKVNGTSLWKLRSKPFSGLEQAGLGLTELCALYLSHSLLDSLVGTPLMSDADRAFLKIEHALPAGCRKFLDRLPRVLKAKASGRKKGNERRLHEVVVRVLDATLLQRRATMCYASAASRRTKTYIVEPQRVAYADGGVYVIAWVPEYGELRTFAAERIATFGLLDETFHPRALPTQPFPNSLGVYSGPAERIVVEFDPDAAPFVREREWHPSQSIAERGDGGIVLTMEVCNDRALRTWILGFGPSARVTEPVRLIQEIFEAATETRRRYQRTIAGQRPEMLSIKAS